MTKGIRGLWLGAAVMAVFAVGCGEPEGSTTCTTDENCGTGKVCHPALKECVPSCTTAADCSSSAASVCAHLDGTAATETAPGFCQCTTNDKCSAADATAPICQPATLLCAAKCAADSGCPTGSKCDTTSGECKVSCTATSCGAGFACNSETGQCESTVTTCNSSNAQPDVCGHTNVCTSANTCEALADGTCANVGAAISAGKHTAFTSASTGPIIYNVVDSASDDETFCSSGVAFTATIYAYAASGSAFGATRDDLPGGFYFLTDGSTRTWTQIARPSGYTRLNGGAEMSLKVTLCGAAGTSQVQAAFGFTGGNAFCATIKK